jgi:hypothetical protein
MSRRRSRAAPAGRAFVQAAQRASLACQPGKQAIGAAYRNVITASREARLTGSVDLDAAFVRTEPAAPRWDYGVGVQAGGVELAIWIEPHPAASAREVDVMLNKLRWFKAKLDEPPFVELKALTAAASRGGIIPFCWLTSSSIHVRHGSREARQLAQAGLRFPARHLSLP